MSDYLSRLFPKKYQKLVKKKSHEWGRKMSVLEENILEKVKEKVKERIFFDFFCKEVYSICSYNDKRLTMNN